MKTKRWIAILIALIMVLALAACSQAKEASQEKVVNLGSTGYWCNDVMDPAAGDTYNGWYIGYYGITQQLFKINANFEPECWLAESCSIIDDNTWEIELRDNVYFHNGPKMTAESVKNCFERTISINERAQAAAEDWLDSIEADGQTLTIHTKRLVSTLKNELADPLWVVYYADEEVDYESGSYYTGPYVLESFAPFEKTVVVKNDNYWGDEPKLDRVNFITVADDSAAIMALEKGEIDMIYPVVAGAVGSLKDNKDVVIDMVTTSRGQFLGFNFNDPALKDVNVRNAIAMCIDREGYAESICDGTVTPSYGIYPAAMPFGGTEGLNLTVDKCDVESAQKLLQEAGYTDSDSDGVLDKDGVPLKMKLVVRSADTDMVSMVEDLQSKLDSIGVKLEIKQMDATVDALEKGDYSIECASYAMAPTGTSDYFVNVKFLSDSPKSYGGFASAELDELAKKLSVSVDETETIDLSRQIQQIILDECAYTFFAHNQYVVAYSNRLTGFNNNPSEYYCLDEYLDIK